MEAAKNAISSITHGGGREDTTVEESVRPAVTSETVKPHRVEETTQAIDREIHQDHYHTTVMPVAHKEVLPEQHTHQVTPVQAREIEHEDDGSIKQRLQEHAAMFKDTSRMEPLKQTTGAGGEQVGEHVHHHVHETVQPVIHKETIQPEVVHTTIPIHETHHAPAEHHGLSTLPVKSLQEFTGSGGKLSGGSGATHAYDGSPRAYDPNFQQEQKPVDREPAAHLGLHDKKSTGHTSDDERDPIRSHGSGAAAGVLGSSGHHHGSNTTGPTGGLGSTGYGNERDVGSGAIGGLGSTGGIGSTGYGNDTNTPSGTTGSYNQSGASGLGSSDSADYRQGHSNLGNLSGTTGVTDSIRRDVSDSTGTDRYGGSTTGNLGTSGATEHGSRDVAAESGNKSAVDDRMSQIQSPAQDRDPAVKGGEHVPKLTGTAADGSHSAVFGLTPDGHKHDETSSDIGKLVPAHSKHSSITPDRSRDSSQNRGTTTGDTETTGTTGTDTLPQQMDSARLKEQNMSADPDSNKKPGAGFNFAPQGTGKVQPADNNTGAASYDPVTGSADTSGEKKGKFMGNLLGSLSGRGSS